MHSGDGSDSPYEEEESVVDDSEDSAGGRSHNYHRMHATERSVA